MKRPYCWIIVVLAGLCLSLGTSPVLAQATSAPLNSHQPHPADGSLKWSFSTGFPVSSSPAIGADGTIYAGSYDGDFYALNPSDGAVKWSTATGALTMESSPAIGADGTIYIGSSGTREPLHFYSSKVYALNPADGSKKWSFTSDYLIPGSPAVGADGTIYIGSEDHSIYALNPADGSIKWRFYTESREYSSPAIGADGTVYTGSIRFYALNPADGLERWSLAGGAQSSPAIGADGTIYLSALDGYVMGVNPADGSVKWSIPMISQSFQSSPVIGGDGTIYIGSFDPRSYYAHVNALSPVDGSLKWSFPTGPSVNSSPAIGADGTIFVASGLGRIYALNPADGSVKWTFTIGGSVSSSPTIGADGTIYVGSSVGVYAINSSCGGLAESPWPKFRRDAMNTGLMPSFQNILDLFDSSVNRGILSGAGPLKPSERKLQDLRNMIVQAETYQQAGYNDLAVKELQEAYKKTDNFLSGPAVSELAALILGLENLLALP